MVRGQLPETPLICMKKKERRKEMARLRTKVQEANEHPVRYYTKQVPLRFMASLRIFLTNIWHGRLVWVKSTTHYVPVHEGEPGYDTAPLEDRIVFGDA